MIVCIAEKPSVAKEIASVLGASAKKDGYFEGNGYQVTWAYGHLFSIKNPQDMNETWSTWNLDHLPMLPEAYTTILNPHRSCRSQYKVIRQLYEKADRIINCGDAGQEGELIQRRIMSHAIVKCPVDRLWISSLTEESIREGFKNLRPQSAYDSLYYAGKARAEGDWLLGMNCTRLYSCKYGTPGRPLSIGRVQTPTLAMVVARDNEIAAFKPMPYWTIQTTYRNVVFSWCGEYDGGTTRPIANHFASEHDALRHLSIARSQELTITGISSKQYQEPSPQLYDLTSLQVDCNRKFGFSADTTLKTMQSLYEKKFATYPRVDTRFLTYDLYAQCHKILSNLKGYETLTAPLAHEVLPMSERVFDDNKVTDHHAIIPTGVVATGLTADELRMYNLICKRFISVFYPPYKYSITTVTAHAASESFKATGRTVIEEGWKSIYPKEECHENNPENSQSLPDFSKSEHGHHEPVLVKKQTTPPKRYTEATLLQAMETAGRLVEDEELRDALKENGIGRPSSRASIIETLLRRNYIIRDKKNLISTETGRQLISVIKDKMLTSPETTGVWEKKLRMIERGEYSHEAFMKELEKQLGEIVSCVKDDDAKISIQDKYNRKSSSSSRKPNVKAISAKRQEMTGKQLEGKTCPRCGKGIIRKGPYSYYCSEYKRGCKFKKPLES